jgi:hypothetical protein
MQLVFMAVEESGNAVAADIMIRIYWRMLPASQNAMYIRQTRGTILLQKNAVQSVFRGSLSYWYAKRVWNISYGSGLFPEAVHSDQVRDFTHTS